MLEESEMTTDTKKQLTPPYVPYSSFTSFINGLKKTGVPSHIDRSIMNTMSGSGQSAMIAALKSMKLINAESEPDNRLNTLVNGSEEEFSTTMTEIVKSTYAFLFDDSIDIKNTTSKKVEDKFRDRGPTGSTLTKCIAFFLAAAKAANIPVSVHVKAPKLQRSSSKAKPKMKDKGSEDTHMSETLPSLDNIPEGMERITVPLRNMDDGVILFPNNLSEEDARAAVKMAKFILNNYYGITEE